MKEINKRNNETQLQFAKRIVNGKLVDKTIDLSFEEISEPVFGKKLSNTEARKRCYGARRIFELMEEENYSNLKDTSNETILKEIEEKLLELEEKTVLYSDQRREYKALVRKNSRKEQLEKEILGQIIKLEENKPIKVDICRYVTNSDSELCVLMSDWHFGLECDNHWNTFNTNIFRLRLEKFTHEIIKIRNIHGSKVLHLFALGDLINGLIHVTTRISNSEDVAEQIMHVTEHIAEMIEYLSPYFERIEFYNVNGNHERITANKSDNVDEESFSYIIPWYLKARFRNFKKVNINYNTYDKGIIVAKVFDYYIFGVHGDKDTPIKSVGNLSNMLKIFPNMIFMGHYHSGFEKNEKGTDIVVNGSLSGVDSYAKEKRLYSQPMQKVVVADKKGKLCTYDVKF